MKKALYAALSLTPMIASAQLGNVQDLLVSIKNLVGLALPIVVGVALLGFFWGLMKFIFNAGKDDEAREAGKKLMIYGIVALFVMVAVWGLVGFIADALQIDTGGEANVPTVPGL